MTEKKILLGFEVGSGRDVKITPSLQLQLELEQTGELLPRRDRVIYCSGLFDGEGTIFIYKWMGKGRRNPQYSVEIGVAMNDIFAVYELKDLFKVGWLSSRDYKMRIGKSCALTYYWGVKGHKAIMVLKELLPYLKTKKPQAELAIEFHEHKETHYPLTSQDLEYREMMRYAISSLNGCNVQKKRGIQHVAR